MKLFLRTVEDNELIFIPSYLYLEKFEKLLRKKDPMYKRMILHFFIEYLLIDKKKTAKSDEIDFISIEKKVIEEYNKITKLEGKLIDRSHGTPQAKNLSEPKENFKELFDEYQKLSKRSKVLTFEDIFKNDFARNFFLTYLEIDFSTSVRKEKSKNIEKHIIGSSHFYIEFYKNKIKDEKWFTKYKHKEVIYSWLAENIANFVTNKKENLENYDRSILFEIFYSYFSYQHNGFPIFNLEDRKKIIQKFNLYVSLTKDEKKIEKNFLEENYKTNIDLNSLNTIKVFTQLVGTFITEKDKLLIQKFFLTILKNCLNNEIEFTPESEFFFDYEIAIDLIKEEESILNTETLAFLDSRINNEEFLIEFFKLINSKNSVQINLLIPIIGKRNSELSKLILNNYWFEILTYIDINFSTSSHNYERVMHEIIEHVPLITLNNKLLLKKNTNFELAAKFLKFYKRKKSKTQFIELSKQIITNLDLTDFEENKRKYFEILDGNVIENFFLNLNKEEISQISNNDGFLKYVLLIENKYIIPKILSVFQLHDINLFENHNHLVSSKYFWTSFEFCLKDNESLKAYIHLTESDYFKKYLLKSEGVNWLKSSVGQYWLSLPNSKSWKQSTEGIFIQKIVLENQQFFIETKEVLESYVSLLSTISKETIDDKYLINNVNEAFKYLLLTDPTLILLLDFENFERYSEIVKIITTNTEKFLTNQNEEIVLRSISCLLHENLNSHVLSRVYLIEKNLEFFLENNISWFTSDNFVTFLQKSKSDYIFESIFNKSITGLSETTQKICEKLIKTNSSKFLNLLIQSTNIPFWITGNLVFIECLKNFPALAQTIINLVGKQYFDSDFRSSMLDHKDWFTEFVNLFAFKNKNILKHNLIASQNIECNSNKCRTKKSGKDKEGFSDFYFTFLAISFYSNSFNQVQRPYMCPYSELKLWHKTSEWNE